MRSPDVAGFRENLPALLGGLALAGVIAVAVMLASPVHTTRSDTDARLVCTAVLGTDQPRADDAEPGVSPERGSRGDTAYCNRARTTRLAWAAVVMTPTATCLALALTSFVVGRRRPS